MTTWKRKAGYEVKKTGRPGIYEMRLGGYLITTQVTDANGKAHATTRTFPTLTTIAEAQREYDDVRRELTRKHEGATSPNELFGDYAASLLERKVASGEVKSQATVEKWRDSLATQGERQTKLAALRIVPQLGGIACRDLRFVHVDHYRELLARAVHRGDLSAATANGWLSIVRVVTAKMSAELEARDPSTGVENIKSAPVYTPDQPNALAPEKVPVFLAKLRELYPMHYAITALGFALGLRPSSFRALRRKGRDADVDLENGWLLVRRSHTRQQVVMADTKTGKHQRIALSPQLVEIVREHIALLDSPPDKRPRMKWTPKMRESELLFPSVKGGFQSRTALKTPFAAVAKTIGVKFTLTPRAMRRTFQDLARAAGVPDVVTRSISGHATESMQAHYSTANASEQLAAQSRILELFIAKSGERSGETANTTNPGKEKSA
jgi:integrase